MPSTIGNVGKLQLPLPAGGANIDDPGLVILSAYLAFRLNYDLNPQLATKGIQDVTTGTTFSTAVPSGNIFLWDPLKPSAVFARGAEDGAPNPLPALYVWEDSAKIVPFSNLCDMRVRTIKVAWIWAQATIPGFNVDKYGLRSAGAASLLRSITQGWHPNFNPTASLAVLMNLCGRGIVSQGYELGMYNGSVPSSVEQSDNPAIIAYPTVQYTCIIHEMEGGMTPIFPQELMGDLLVNISVAPYELQNDVLNTVLVSQKVLPAPPYEATV